MGKFKDMKLMLAANLEDISATEAGFIDGVTAGTSAASKAVVLSATSKIDTIDMTAWKVGGTAVTSTAAELNILDTVTSTAGELNLLDDTVATITFAAASAAANVCEVTITMKDAAGATIDAVHNFDCWLSDAATGATLTTTSASGTVTVKSASGDDLGALTAKKMFRAQTLATGIFTLEITDTAKTTFYVCASLPSGKAQISTILATGDYGA